MSIFATKLLYINDYDLIGRELNYRISLCFGISSWNGIHFLDKFGNRGRAFQIAFLGGATILGFHYFLLTLSHQTIYSCF